MMRDGLLEFRSGVTLFFYGRGVTHWSRCHKFFFFVAVSHTGRGVTFFFVAVSQIVVLMVAVSHTARGVTAVGPGNPALD